MVDERVQQHQKFRGNVGVRKLERLAVRFANQNARLFDGEIGVVRHVEAAGSADGKDGCCGGGDIGFGLGDSGVLDVQIQRAPRSNMVIVNIPCACTTCHVLLIHAAARRHVCTVGEEGGGAVDDVGHDGEKDAVRALRVVK